MLYLVSFIGHLIVAMNQKRKSNSRVWGTAVPSPESLGGTGAEAKTTVCRDALPEEYSSPVSPDGSVGFKGLCALSLDTPKKKAKVLSESLLHDQKEKLQKDSRKGSQNSSQVSLQCRSS